MKLIIKIITLLFSLFLSVSIAANDCSTIDLDKNGGSMSNIPPLDQGSSNTCYSHTGSVMIDAWLHSHGGDKSKLTSSLSAAVFNKSSVMAAGLGNISCEAIEAVEDYGRCEKKDFDDKVWDKFDIGSGFSKGRRAKEMFEMLEKFYERPPRRFGSPKKSRNSEYRRKLKKWKKRNTKMSQYLYCHKDQFSLGSFDNTNFKDIENALNSYSKDTFLKEMTVALCGNSFEDISDKLPDCESDMRILHSGKKTPRKYKKKIHSLLESENPQPIGVGYCGRLLYNDSKFRGYKKGFLGFTSLDTATGSECGLHESVVIGRKKVNGKCMLKIRNSWGADAKYRYWESDNNGNVWVDEDAFTENMGSISYFE